MAEERLAEEGNEEMFPVMELMWALMEREGGRED